MKIEMAYNLLFGELFSNCTINMLGIATERVDVGKENLVKVLEKDYEKREVLFKIPSVYDPLTELINLEDTTYLVFGDVEYDIDASPEDILCFKHRPEAIVFFWHIKRRLFKGEISNTPFYVFKDVIQVEDHIIKLKGIRETHTEIFKAREDQDSKGE